MIFKNFFNFSRFFIFSTIFKQILVKNHQILVIFWLFLIQNQIFFLNFLTENFNLKIYFVIFNNFSKFSIFVTQTPKNKITSNKSSIKFYEKIFIFKWIPPHNHYLHRHDEKKTQLACLRIYFMCATKKNCKKKKWERRKNLLN